jgi:ADP-dependent NAD(P)H-hydrate dehydratase / NAD(P)H-hydrate epimerase
MMKDKEVHVLDKNAEFQGVKTSTLMENAGKHVANFTDKTIRSKSKKILVFCGVGNNGGDGFVAARYLSKKYDTAIFLTGDVKDIKTDISKKNFDILKKTKTKIFDIKSSKTIDELISEHSIIIDAMLGIGLSGELREPYLSIINKINSSKNKKILSVDVPTGIGTKTCVKPDYTITFHDSKENMNKNNCGDIKIADIGIPKKAEEYVGPGELSTYYPKPKTDSHKGENGRLLIIGGGPYYGAPALSAFGALRTGADLVFVLTPKKVARAITSYSPLIFKPQRFAKKMAKFSPNLIVKELSDNDIFVPDDLKIAKKYSKKIDTLLIGPGLGNDEKTLVAAEEIIKFFVKSKKSIVIDADAIKIVGKNPSIIKNSKTIITPHTGEFNELTGVKLSSNINERSKKTKDWAKKLGTTIVLKGHIDVISNGKIIKLNDVHNQAMTVGGTGDVLAGITGALVSKGVKPFNAARIAVFLNGSAGNLAFKKKSFGLISTDVIEEIPNVLRKYL